MVELLFPLVNLLAFFKCTFIFVSFGGDVDLEWLQ